MNEQSIGRDEALELLGSTVANYTVLGGGKKTLYRGFDCNTRAYSAHCIPAQNDVAENGTFFSDEPNIAGPELERYFREQWGRNVKVLWEVV